MSDVSKGLWERQYGEQYNQGFFMYQLIAQENCFKKNIKIYINP